MVLRGRISLLALALVALLAGCGGDGNGEIPADDAEKLEARLDEVERAVAEGECEGAQESADLLVVQVGDGEDSVVPRRVDDEVREALQAAAARLSTLVSEQCTEPVETEDPPEEEPTEPAEPAPPPEEEAPPEEAPPEDEDDNSGSGQGGGNPGSGGGGNSGGGSGSGGTGPPASGGTESG